MEFQVWEGWMFRILGLRWRLNQLGVFSSETSYNMLLVMKNTFLNPEFPGGGLRSGAAITAFRFSRGPISACRGFISFGHP